ncbi:MAG: hypothetical protein DRP12_00175 [Candidatus Aenigmatarchaeota archaeon]|nr:MAG: hypothetical protein DRP12_00175 [Candidatus Aenigmarchaeota archaeon]
MRIRSLTDLQIVRREKPVPKVYIRAVPRTAFTPTENQIKARILFAEIAKKAKGMKMTEDLPPAAKLIEREMKPVGRRKKKAIWEERLETAARIRLETIIKAAKLLRLLKGKRGILATK